MLRRSIFNRILYHLIAVSKSMRYLVIDLLSTVSVKIFNGIDFHNVNSIGKYYISKSIDTFRKI